MLKISKSLSKTQRKCAGSPHVDGDVDEYTFEGKMITDCGLMEICCLRAKENSIFELIKEMDTQWRRLLSWKIIADHVYYKWTGLGVMCPLIVGSVLLKSFGLLKFLTLFYGLFD